MQIVFEPEHFRSAAYDGETRVGVAELEEARGCWVITHTEVDPAYGGQGIARRLIEKIIAEAAPYREEDRPHLLLCREDDARQGGIHRCACRLSGIRSTKRDCCTKFSNFVQQSRELTEIHIICIDCCVYAFRDER